MLTLLVCSSLLSLLAYLAYSEERWKAGLAPGPRGYPFLRNVFDMPSKEEYLVYTKWGRIWGDLVSVTIPGYTFLIINSLPKALEILDDKSHIYSSRPTDPVLGEIAGFSRLISMSPSGIDSQHREARKLLYQEVGSATAVRSLYGLLEDSSESMVRRLMKDPNGFYTTLEHVLLQATYGYTPLDTEDPLVKIIEDAAKLVPEASVGATPLLTFIRLFPSLRHLPAWIFGPTFRKKTRDWRSKVDAMVEVPFRTVVQEMEDGVAVESFTSKWLGRDLSTSQRLILENTAGTMFLAGVETSSAAIHAAIYILATHPNILQKAQNEVDNITNFERLPNCDDIESMPFLIALAKEVLRWQVPLPYGVFHRVTEDDVHGNYLIPKNSIVVSNIWAMSRDSEYHHDPERFNPERFLGPKPELDPSRYIFGFGRRVCPGERLAVMQLQLSIARIVSVFDIEQEKDEEGRVVPPVYENVDGQSRHVKPFKCEIRPRECAAKLLEVLEGRV